MRQKTLRELARIAREAARTPDAALRTVASNINAAKKEVLLAIRKWQAEKGFDGDARFTLTEYRKVLKKLERAERRIAQLAPDVSNALKGGEKLATGVAKAHFREVFTVLSREFDGDAPLIPRAVWRFAGLREQLWMRYETSAARYAGSVGDHIRQQFQIGILRRESWHDMARRMVGLKRKVPTVDRAVDGLFRRPHYWAERLVRTEVMHAYGAARDMALKNAHREMGLLKMWDSTADSRLCIQCASLHGEVVVPGEPYPDGTYHPPAHPQCRCSEIPWREEWRGTIERPEQQRTIRKRETA